jgi:TPR repeat protein
MNLQSLGQGHPLGDPKLLQLLSSKAYKEYLSSGSIECINSAVTLGQASVRLLNDGDRWLPSYLNNLGNMLWARYNGTGQQEDLERALATVRKAVDLTPRDHPDRIPYLVNLGNQLSSRYNRTGSIGYLEEAIKVATEAVELSPLTKPSNREHFRPACLSGLSNMLESRYLRTGQVHDLEKAIETSREAVNSTVRDDPSNGGSLNNLGNQIERMYELTGRISDLDEAIETARQAAKLKTDDNQIRAMRLTNLAKKLGSRFRQTSQIDDLEEGIKFATQALDFLPQETYNRSAYLTNLGNLLESRYIRTGRIDDLTLALEMTRQAVDLTPQEHPYKAKFLSNLANLLERRYLRTGQDGDIDEAIKVSKESVTATPFEHLDRLAYMNNFSNKLIMRYERRGQIGDLEEALELSRQAARSTPQDHRDRSSRLGNLGYILKSRYERTGQLDDLEAAIEITRQATNSALQRDADMVTNLANYLGQRYERTRQLSNLEEAIELARKASDLTPENHSQRAVFLSNLGNKLEQRYVQTNQLSDLEEAIEVASKAVESTPKDQPDRPMWLHNLAHKFEARYVHLGQIDDLQRAIDVARQAVDLTPQDHPDMVARLGRLGRSLEKRYERNHEITDLEEASSCFQDAWNMRTATPFHRIVVGARGLQLFAVQRKFDVAIQIGKEIIELLPTVNTKVLDRADQQFVVSTFSGVAADVCAVLLETNQLLEALKYLEMGRTVIIGQLLDAQSDISSLRECSPEIAARYERLVYEVNVPLRKSTQDPFQEQNLSKLQALAKLEACILEIRAIKGQERFLLSQTQIEMQKCAAGGTIVVVNISNLRSDAILVSASAIKTIHLSSLKVSEVKVWLSKKWKCRRLERTKKNEEYLEYLSWLWKVCVKNVIEEVHTGHGTTDYLPRIWWVGSGMASSMPFHAAGNHALGSTEDALNMAISSYTPSIRALAYSQGRTDSIHGIRGSLLLVTMPTTPGDPTDPSVKKLQDLLKVDKEKNIVIELCKDMQVDFREAPSVEQVLGAMKKCCIAHFACHGYTNHQDPSNSGLILQKFENGLMKQDRLTVREISALRLPNARVAYLSACSTAENNAPRLEDEVIHVASGFQVAGFPHVVGCLWPSNDRVCMDVASSFYSSLLSEDLIEWDGRVVASAVWKAVQAARAEAIRRPLEWAPFVHYGV